VQTAEVEGQLAVDEHPEVVVPDERELLTARVAEAGVNLGGEAVVVRAIVKLPLTDQPAPSTGKKLPLAKVEIPALVEAKARKRM